MAGFWLLVALSCSSPPDSVMAFLQHRSLELVKGPLHVAPDYPDIPAPEPRLYVAGCSDSYTFVGDLHYRVIYVLDRSWNVHRMFFIRSDHTPPFSMTQAGSYWVMVAYRHEPSIREQANWGTWLQVYDTTGRFLHALFPVPDAIRSLGWRGGFRVYIVPVGLNRVWAVFNIGDCVNEITLPSGPVRPLLCGLQKKLGIPEADPAHPLVPETGVPQVKGWVKQNGGWSLVVQDHAGEQDTLTVARRYP
jgi:hypothetical protein